MSATKSIDPDLDARDRALEAGRDLGLADPERMARYADQLGRAVGRGRMKPVEALHLISERVQEHAVTAEPDKLRADLNARMARATVETLAERGNDGVPTPKLSVVPPTVLTPDVPPTPDIVPAQDVRAASVRMDAATAGLTPDARTVHEALRVVIDHRLAAEPPAVRDALKANAAAALERHELVEGPVTLTPAIRIAAGKPPEPDATPPMRAQAAEEFGAMARAVRECSATPDALTPPDAAETRRALQEMFAGAASVSALGKLYAEPDVKRSIDAVSAHPEQAALLRTTMEAAETRVVAVERARHGLDRPSVAPPISQPPPVTDATPDAPVLTITRRGDNGGPALDPASPVLPAAAPVEPKSGAAWDAAAAGYIVKDRGEVREYYQRDDGQLAMRATDQRIDGVLRDGRTVGAMLDLAASRGWNDVQIAGDIKVARATWVEATARGMQAEGYRPTHDDLHAAEQRRLERRGQGLDAPDAPVRAVPVQGQVAPERRQGRNEPVEPPRADQTTPASAERTAPPSSRPSRNDVAGPGWTTREGGYDALPPAERASAERSYETWKGKNPELGAKHDLAGYVSYVQERQAEARQELRMPLPKVETPRVGMRL